MRAAVLALALLALPAAAGPAALLATTWDILAPLPAARTEVTAVAVGEKVYVLGGLNAGGTGSRRVDIYDPAANAWSQGPMLPQALHHTAAVALGTRLLVIGGYHDGTFAPVPNTWLLETALPPALQAWLPFAPLPTPRGAHAAATDGSRVWIFGGVGAAGLDTTALRLDGIAGLALPVWLPMAALPDPRDHLAGAFLDGQVYAAGGRDLTLATNTARLDRYDPASDRWVRGPDMPTPRGGIAAAPLAGTVVVFGGEAPGGVTYSAAEAYDPATDAWQRLAPMPHSRHGLGAAALGGAVYVEAGGPVAGLTVSAHNERIRVV